MGTGVNALASQPYKLICNLINHTLKTMGSQIIQITQKMISSDNEHSVRGEKMSFEALRKAMVDSQIRPNKVFEQHVIDAFLAVPRELFVPKHLQNIAYIDEDISLSGGRYIMEAMVIARLFQLLDIKKTDSVMSVASGTGYASAVLSYLAESVIGIETRAPMVEKAQNNMSTLGIGNVAFVKSRLQDGLASEAPFDVIFIEGGIEVVPHHLFAQLNEGGRLAAVKREPDQQVGEACIWVKTNDTISKNAVFTAQVPILDEFKAKPKFTF